MQKMNRFFDFSQWLHMTDHCIFSLAASSGPLTRDHDVEIVIRWASREKAKFSPVLWGLV